MFTSVLISHFNRELIYLYSVIAYASLSLYAVAECPFMLFQQAAYSTMCYVCNNASLHLHVIKHFVIKDCVCDNVFSLSILHLLPLSGFEWINQVTLIIIKEPLILSLKYSKDLC